MKIIWAASSFLYSLAVDITKEGFSERFFANERLLFIGKRLQLTTVNLECFLTTQIVGAIEDIWCGPIVELYVNLF